MKVGDRVRCIDPEPSRWTGLEAGKVYVVRRTFTGPPSGTEDPIPELRKEPGVYLAALPGAFLERRFEKADDE